jgi:hypothetical protein
MQFSTLSSVVLGLVALATLAPAAPIPRVRGNRTSTALPIPVVASIWGWGAAPGITAYLGRNKTPANATAEQPQLPENKKEEELRVVVAHAAPTQGAPAERATTNTTAVTETAATSDAPLPAEGTNDNSGRRPTKRLGGTGMVKGWGKGKGNKDNNKLGNDPILDIWEPGSTIFERPGPYTSTSSTSSSSSSSAAGASAIVTVTISVVTNTDTEKTQTSTAAATTSATAVAAAAAAASASAAATTVAAAATTTSASVSATTTGTGTNTGTGSYWDGWARVTTTPSAAAKGSAVPWLPVSVGW